SLLQVNDVDTISLSENVRSHLWVPSSSLVTKVDTCFKQLLHCNNVCHIKFLLWFYILSSRSEEHTSELQSRFDLVCRLLLEKKKLYTKYFRQPYSSYMC